MLSVKAVGADGAGANLKHKADISGSYQGAGSYPKDGRPFAGNNLRTPYHSCYHAHVFLYVDKFNRNRRGRYFKEVKRKVFFLDEILAIYRLASPPAD